MTRSILAAALAAALLTACGSSTEPEAAPAPQTSSSVPATPATPTTPATPAEAEGGTPAAAPAPGRYVDLADFDPASAEGTDIVYFFHADWCHFCRDTEASLEADGVPDGLTVVKVGYDEELALRQEYGVTTQHTFVQVSPEGERLAIWTGSETGDEIAAETT